MKTTSVKPAVAPTSAERLRLEDEKLLELRRHEKRIVAEIVALEQEEVKPRQGDPAGERAQRALALLADPDAKVAVAPAPPTAEVQLHALRESQRDYQAAIQEQERRIIAAHQARSRELVAEHGDAWAGLQRQRAKALIDLLRVNRAIEDLKGKQRSGGQQAGLPLDGFTFRLFGTGGTQTPANQWACDFLNAAAKAGLVDAEAFKNV